MSDDELPEPKFDLPKPFVCPLCHLSFNRADYEAHLLAKQKTLNAAIANLPKPVTTK